MKTAAALLAILLSAAFAPAPRAADLAWLSGRWVQEGAAGWTEESWTRPRGGTMLGTGLSGKGDAAASFEFMRIAEGPEGLVFWGSPGGQAAVAFPPVEAGERLAVFENPNHDYPTRIVYRRDGRVLTATVSGPGGADPQSVRYTRR